MNRIKNRIKNTFSALFDEITVFEYVLWWIARLMMLIVVIFCVESERVMCFINMLALYAVSAIRFVAPKSSFLARLSFRCQHIVNFIEIIGTFFGNFLNAYAHIFKYDRILHLLSGPLAIIAGYYVVKAIISTPTETKTPSAALASTFSFCFSFLIIGMWEITEFLGDYFFGSQNQCFYYAPNDDDIWFRLFGDGALHGEGQFPLWDTMMDMIDAAFTTIVSAIVMYAVLKILEKRREKKLVAEKSAQSAETATTE
ncbi:MAG: hypothetical protein ACI4XE_10895 [Acutalibacteraceae bacterium]